MGTPGTLLARIADREQRAVRRLSPEWRRVRWRMLAYVPAVVALAQVRRRIRFPRPVMIPLASLAPLAVSEALPRGRWRHAAVWATYVWLFKVAWEIPYDRPDKLGRRLRIHGNVRLDSLLGGGEPPTLRLQRALRHPPRLTLLDVVLTAAYYGLWLAPHAVVVWILLRHEEHFPRAAGRLAAVYHLATVGYWLRPSAPPWWAAEQEGEMDGAVQRVPREVERALLERVGNLDHEGRTQGDGDDAGNLWASMPSDHFVAACMTAMIMAEFGPVAAAVGWADVAIVGFAVVYLGEHYVVDLIASLALAEGVRRAEPVASPFLRFALSLLRALEPPPRAPSRLRRRHPVGR